jgi:predicted Zn finger-like uncharacterized protein
VFTQCSKCETVFRLSADVLRAAGGQVRCGKCGEVFNALAHLAEDPSAFTVGETSIDLETRADSILESPTSAPASGPPPDSAENPVPPGVEIARLQILDWSDDELPPVQSIDQDAPAEEPAGEASLEFTLPPGELDRIFVESKKGVRPPQPKSPEPPETPEDIEIFGATNGAPTPSGFEVSEDVRREMLSGLDENEPPVETEADETEVADEMEVAVETEVAGEMEVAGEIELLAQAERPARRQASPFAPTPQENDRWFKLWFASAVAAGLILIAQVVHQNREWLSIHAPLGSVLSSLYAKLGTPVASAANLSAYQLRQWGVTGDPSADGILRVRASILNASSRRAPYPLLRVTLANRFGGRIGTRDFEPAEYLSKPPPKLLGPGEGVDATVDILDPGKSAEGFELDVCLRGADAVVSCANEAAAAQAKR